MEVVVFGADRRPGLLIDGDVVDVCTVSSEIPRTLEGFIRGGKGVLEQAHECAEIALQRGHEDVVRSATLAELHAPWPGRRIACAGANYAEHVLGMSVNLLGRSWVTIDSVLAESRASGQWGFWKVPVDVAGPGDEIPIPSRTAYFDYEGEVAVVIGRQGKNIRAEDTASYVWGLTLANDWSIRDDPLTRFPLSYNLAKNFDFSVSMGPAIEVGNTDPQSVRVETRVNGDLRQAYTTAEMIFSFAEIIEMLSRDFTLVPGDIICGGTSAGTAADRTLTSADGSRGTELFLAPGDVVEIESPSIGKLMNTVIDGSSLLERTQTEFDAS